MITSNAIESNKHSSSYGFNSTKNYTITFNFSSNLKIISPRPIRSKLYVRVFLHLVPRYLKTTTKIHWNRFFFVKTKKILWNRFFFLYLMLLKSTVNYIQILVYMLHIHYNGDAHDLLVSIYTRGFGRHFQGSFHPSLGEVDGGIYNFELFFFLQK